MRARQIDLHHRTRKKIELNIFKAPIERDLRLEKRLKGILLCADGYTSGDIAHKLKTSRQKVSLWLKTFDESGIEGLYTKPKSGRPPSLSGLQIMLLCDIIDSGPIAYGLNTGVWTSPIIRGLICEEFGIWYHDRHVRRLLKEFGFSVQRPRHLLAQC